MKRHLREGDKVRSLFRARWVGVVIGAVGGGCFVVRITHDRNGRPIRKPLSKRNVRTLAERWLEIL